jgi:caa(3)-type oxidase subunit IV
MTEHALTDHATAGHAGAGHAHEPRDYIRIWALLCVLLVVSVIGPTLEIRVVTLITAFGVAIVKAYLVAKHFMHLGIEKRWVAYILLAMLAFMLVYFGGVAPDVLKQTGHQWDKTYTEPASAAGEPAAH